MEVRGPAMLSLPLIFLAHRPSARIVLAAHL
jgi:hypothetical protein